ncbi:MAG: LPS export ABC transporter permease LptG, partial [Desulfobacteraceae bacterium]|nr:LPS export ABC transporter permease LptG [Desulfobacteraceae bacterium]
IVQYFVYKLPLIMIQITPLGVLLSVLITFGLMAKNNELTALRSSGISLLSLTGPIMRCGIAGALILILLAEVIAPLTVTTANRIWLQEVRGQNFATTRHNDIWLKGHQVIVHLKHFQPAAQAGRGLALKSDAPMAMGITVNRFDGQFRLVERIDAKTATYQQGGWLLHDGMLQQRSANDGHMVVSQFNERRFQFDLPVEDLAQAAPQTEEMSFVQLYRYTRKVEAEGYDATRYRVDLHAKIAFPFLCIILTLMGAGLAARGKIRDGLAISIGYGIGIAFMYWVVFGFCLSMGYAGMLPPVIAAWGVNFVFMCLAGYMLLAAD